MTMEKKLCPVCRDGESLPFDGQEWRVDGCAYRLVSCQACSSIFTTPPPSDATLGNLYRTSFDFRWYQDHYDAKLRDCRMRIQEYGSRLGKRVLDFGGGVGYFSKAASEAGLECITYDPYVSTALPSGSSRDCVVALHVLEHSNDLDRTIAQIKSFLAPGGRVIIAVPNAAGLGYQKLGMRWVWAQPPLIHIFHFTAAGLMALLSRHGFGDIQVSYHERWDANLVSDLQNHARQKYLDSLWGLRPLNRFPLYRKLVASIVSQFRFADLKRAQKNNSPDCSWYSELVIVARKPKT